MKVAALPLISAVRLALPAGCVILSREAEPRRENLWSGNGEASLTALGERQSRLLPTAYCLLFFPAAYAGTGSRPELNACLPAASPDGRCRCQFRRPAACRKKARECSLHPSPSPLHPPARAAAPGP